MDKIDKERYDVVEMAEHKNKESDDEFPYDYHEKRYMIVDTDSGEIVDDAQGWGFKSKKKAFAFLHYKLNQKEIEASRSKVKKWCKENKSFCRALDQALFYAVKDGERMTNDEIISLAKEYDLELPCDVKEFMKMY